MKPIIIVLSIIALGSMGYGIYQQSQVGSLNAELKEVQDRVLAAEAEVIRQKAIGEQNRLMAEKVQMECIKQLAECEKNRK